MPYHCHTIAIPLPQHHASSPASTADTWSGMKAYGRRGRATVRRSDHSLAITCPNLPLPPTTGYFVKPTIPFDRISSRPCTAQCRPIYMEPSDKPTKCVLYTPEGLTAYKGYMAPMFAAICTLRYSSFLLTQRSKNKRGLSTCHGGQKLKLASMLWSYIA